MRLRDDLYRYYEKELTFIRHMAREFAEKYPGVAQRLMLEPDRCQDPHVERIIESFAFLAARIHLKLDDEFPQITEALLQVLYPHYLAPVPSMSIAQFTLDPDQGKISTGYPIDRHRRLFWHARADVMCSFRTCYPVTLWPLEVRSARIEAPGPIDRHGRPAPAALVLRLATQADATFTELELTSLRFFLSGEGHLVHKLYEALIGHCSGLSLRNPASETDVVRLPPAVSEVGFGKDEGLLPYSTRSHLGYRLIQEYFSFPAKFLFFDVTGLEHLRTGGFDREAELVFLLDQVPRVDQRLEPDTFRLGCTPIVNLFQRTADTIRLDHAHTEYRVTPDARQQHSLEVYSVDQVVGQRAGHDDTVFHPFYSFKHSFDGRRPTAFWHATRRQSGRKDVAGTDVFLTLVDRDFRATTSDSEYLLVDVTCTNRDWPGRPDVPTPTDLSLEGAAPVKRVACLMKPSAAMWPPMRHETQWGLISHLSLNYLSPVEGDQDGSPEALREILRLYDFSDSAAIQQQIDGVVAVRNRQVMRRIRLGGASGFARGVEATLEFDESRYAGAGVFLFSSVLEKFLALCVSVNSFSELIAISRQRGGEVNRWPPRSGYQPLL